MRINFFQWSRVFNVRVNQPRRLGGLQTNTTCNLFGFGSSGVVPTHHSLFVLGSSYCNPGLPRVFCTILPSLKHVSCGANEGSPVVCSDETVDGILLNQENCTTVGDNVRLSYHSITEFSEWIAEISAAQTFSKTSVFLILSAVAISLAKFNVIL